MSDKRFESSKAESPNKFVPALAIGAGLSLAAGIGGAIAGQLLIPIPVLGAAIGAGVGAATGQGIEEGVEALAGVSKQSGSEIAADLGIKGTSDYVRVSELKKQAVQKLIDTVDHSQVLDYL